MTSASNAFGVTVSRIKHFSIRVAGLLLLWLIPSWLSTSLPDPPLCTGSLLSMCCLIGWHASILGIPPVQTTVAAIRCHRWVPTLFPSNHILPLFYFWPCYLKSSSIFCFILHCSIFSFFLPLLPHSRPQHPAMQTTCSWGESELLKAPLLFPGC